jgi:hypothetical protein
MCELTDHDMIRGMAELFEWGSGDYLLNKELLIMFENDV